MTTPATTITSDTRKIRPELAARVLALKAGDRIRVRQRVRVGAKTWTAETAGVYRSTNYLATGLATDRVPEDDIVVPLVHFTKDNGELASVCLDEYSEIDVA